MASKSLGTLTLDLVARVGGFVQGMDAAERKSAKWRRQVEEDAKKVGTAIGAATAAAAAATTALVVSQVKAAGEISRMAQVSNAGAQEFQRYAIAADAVGISQEKLSDQLKDFTEKVGEFQQSGGGGMRDFFEQIAPQIGITAEAFRDLSGPQALQLYYDSLEQAGLSQQQMSFYLESMASDTTALIPLLRDGGAGFKLLADEAERAGAIMGADTITAAEQLSAAMFIANQALDGFQNTVGAELLPILGDLASGLSDVSTDGAIAEDVAGVLGGTLKGLAAAAVGAFAALQLVGKGIAGVAAAADAGMEGAAWYERVVPALAARRIYQNWQGVKGALDVVGEDLDETAQRYASLLDDIWSAGDGGSGSTGAESRVQRIADLMREMREAAGQASGSVGQLGIETEKQRKAAEAAAKAIDGQITAIERAAAVWGMSADEVQLYDLAQKGANKSQLEYAAGVLKTVSALEDQKEAQEKYKSLLADLRTEEEVLTDQARERLKVLDAISDLTDEERNKAVSRIAGQLTQDAPGSPGVDGAVGGAAGEMAKLAEAERELEKWYDTQLSMLRTFREERADEMERWDAEELEVTRQHQAALAAIESSKNTVVLESSKQFFGEMAVLSQSGNKRLGAIGKAAAIAQATISGFQAIQNALAVPPYPVGLALAVSAGVMTAANIASIAGVGFRSGGYTGDGGVNDVAGVVHKGEYVLPADVTRRLGVANLDALKNGKVDRAISSVGSGGTSSRSGAVINMSIDMSGMQTGRDAREAGGSIARKVARAVGSAQRYN